jgi:two-component system response regulator MprA
MSNRKCVLVVDDDAAIRLLIADALEFEGYEVITATDGADALAKLLARHPDAIVLDLMMPVMDGRAFLAAAREAEMGGRSTPVLVLSASHDLPAIAPQLGVRACLCKPFDLDILLAVVERLVEAEPQPALSGV